MLSNDLSRLRYYGNAHGGYMKDRFRIKEQMKVRRNIPAHIAFWTFALLLLYIFYKAFSGNSGQ
jgi:hypothetical protein